MIELKAILAASGRAFIKDGDRYYHLAPPYTLDTYEEVPRHDIEEAISGYGFTKADVPFENHKDLCNYLLQNYNQWKTAHNKADRTMTNADRLRRMPADMFKIFLENLRQKHKEGMYQEVYYMGLDMMQNKYKQELLPEMEELKYLMSYGEKSVKQKLSVFADYDSDNDLFYIPITLKVKSAA